MTAADHTPEGGLQLLHKEKEVEMSQTAEVTRSTREVAEDWFDALTRGDADSAFSLLDPDVEFINYTPVPGFNTDMQWIGTHHGTEAALQSLNVFLSICEVRFEELLKLIVEDDEAIGVIHEISSVRATGKEFDIEFVQRLTVRDGKIIRWKSYTDPSPIIRALRSEG